jgi:hypothetical protein
MLAGLAGAMFAAWWMRRRRTAGRGEDAAERGEVIFSNSPVV